MFFWVPANKTIIHEKIKTIIVLNAVAKEESTFFKPIFARTAVTPANKADRQANPIHTLSFPLYLLYLYFTAINKKEK